MSDTVLAPAAAEPKKKTLRWGDGLSLRWRKHAGILGALALFLVLYLFYQMSHPRGFTGQILIQNANEVFALALVSMAQTVPVLMAGLDLSVGAVMTLVGCIASHLVDGSPTDIALGIVACIAAGATCGFVNGCVVVYGRIQPIIATLATSAIYMGLALILRPTPGGKVQEDLSWAVASDVHEFAATFGLFDDGEATWLQPFAWIPVPLVLLALIILVIWVPFTRSVMGRTVYAIGSSETAAYMSGLPINRAKLAAFTLAGLFAGLGGLFLALQTSSGNADIPQAGAYTLNSIAAVVIGGTSLLGGTGSAIGSMIGAMVLRTISFNFRIFDVAPLLQPLFEGLVLLAAVSIGGLKLLRLKNRLEIFR
ncbi:ABC transporter permease [Microvirga guangxiensis]|uniref:Monosaccharide ABC transporter membrane protein, CUT2 family n=1 Tax=Microvirga guangxiensis TaxID=549386 RepID=A0A1G5LHC5_9HYPH|nr:ABC transporter permease [Microvirga guangxiensis]SCZ12355.1 monosaccharide ABC transporter membrane protein, CUT2 family [Microvirga guangxiensis]